MTDSPTVPLSHSLGVGQRDTRAENGTAPRDSRGTPGLKALARKVLARNTAWDSRGTVANLPVPSSGTVGQQVSHQDLPADWAAGLCELEVCACPEGIPARRWQIFRKDAARFASEGWALQVFRLGWSLLDVFGLHPEKPAERHDAAGVIWLLDGHAVLLVSKTSITVRTSTDRPLNIYRRHHPVRAVPAWELTLTQENAK